MPAHDEDASDSFDQTRARQSLMSLTPRRVLASSRDAKRGPEISRGRADEIGGVFGVDACSCGGVDALAIYAAHRDGALPREHAARLDPTKTTRGRSNGCGRAHLSEVGRGAQVRPRARGDPSRREACERLGSPRREQFGTDGEAHGFWARGVFVAEGRVATGQEGDACRRDG